MSKTILQMCLLAVCLITLQALGQDEGRPDCNRDIQDSTSYGYCTFKVECNDFTQKDGCSTKQVTPSPSSFYYKCKGGSLPSDDCVIDPTERQCAAVYTCKDQAIVPPEKAGEFSCVQDKQALNDKGEPRFVYTVDTAQTRDCIAKKKGG